MTISSGKLNQHRPISPWMRRLPLAGTYASLLLAGPVLSAPALAQESARATSLEEVVVTARRREELSQDVPIAISSLSDEFLAEQRVTELGDLGTLVPSLRISSSGTSTNAPNISLRGQRPAQTLLTLDPSIPVYFAEIPLTPTQGTNLAMYDLANVQVLKGPQGTLFGRNSTGGAILVSPKTPGSEFGGYATVTLGSYDLVQVEGAVDVPVSDLLRFRLAGRKIDRDGYQSNVADNPLRCDDCIWDEDSGSVRLTAEFSPTDRLNNITTITYDGNDMISRQQVPVAFAGSNPEFVATMWNLIHNGGLGALSGLSVPEIDNAIARQKQRDDWQKVEADLLAPEKVKNILFINSTEFEVNDAFSIKNIFGYRDLSYDGAQNSDGMAVPLFASRTSLTEHYTLNPSESHVDAEQYSEELQFFGTALDGKLDWLLGGFWIRMKGSEYFPSDLSGANPDWPSGPAPDPSLAFFWNAAQQGFKTISQDMKAENEGAAIFGEATYTLSDAWSFTLGARQTWDKRGISTDRLTGDGSACDVYDENNQQLPLDDCYREESKKFSQPTWRAIANFKPDLDKLLYASVSTGYVTGGFNARGNSNFTLKPFDPETVLNYEVGAKMDWSLGDMSLRTNAAAYFQKYDDIQKTQGVVVGQTYGSTIINVAKAEIKGFELDVTLAPNPYLQLTLGYSYVDAAYNEWNLDFPTGEVDGNGTPITRTVDNSGAPFTYIPENTLTAGFRVIAPLSPDIGELSFSGSYYWQDEMSTNDRTTEWASSGWSEQDLEEVRKTLVVDGYGVLNLRADWREVMGSGFDVAAFVTNATDEAQLVGGTSVPDQLGTVTEAYGRPREYGVSVYWNF